MSIDIFAEAGAEQDALVDRHDLTTLAEFLFDALRIAKDSDLSIALVDVDRMTELHIEYLDEPGPTDVISIPMDELREPDVDAAPVVGQLGDVIICPEVARQQAKNAGHSTQDECRILLTHGVLHLLGNDHAEPEEARAMFARQSQLLRAFAANGIA